METDLEKYVLVLAVNKWYSGKELSEDWGLDENLRKNMVMRLIKRNMLQRKGKTSNVRYKKVPSEKWGKKPVKSLLPAKKPPPSSLDELINAVTKVGTENEFLVKTLRDIRKQIDEALEKI